jgi:hypothetical protein
MIHLFNGRAGAIFDHLKIGPVDKLGRIFILFWGLQEKRLKNDMQPIVN